MKKGFVLLETIAVLSIICVTLITLYGGYVRIIKNVKLQNYYDNTEYIYKAKTVGDFIANVVIEKQIMSDDLFIYCNTTAYQTEGNINPTFVTCDNSGLDYNGLLKEMRVAGVYITKWNTRDIDTMSLLQVEPTTQKYIRHINDKKGSGYRIIVMFKDRLDSSKYQYASVRYVPKS